jgi:hypothetical protein
VLAQPGYKGSFAPFVVFLATIKFDPGDVKVLEGHPVVELVRTGFKATPAGEKLTFQPTWSLTPQNLKSMTVRGHRLFGDTAVRPEIGPAEATVTPAKNNS